MADIVKITDRTTGSCSGMTLPAFEIVVNDGRGNREYRLREWAWKSSWVLQVLNDGASGECDSDFTDVAEFPSKQAALAFLEASTSQESGKR